jgi:BirA family biotin operon repressor/biotin-[acetyl-CoA-carboxylase] ligase
MPHSPAQGQPFILLDKVGSTNNYAMARINDGEVSEGTIYFAREQVAGKGQRGKQWISAPGENIVMSVVLKPHHLQLPEQFMLSMAVALGSYDFVKKYAGETTRIKWSNDLYWNDKKAGGILIENVIRGKTWSYAVAGIGLNVNQRFFPPGLPNPVSLNRITGKRYDVITLAKELGGCILYRYGLLKPENFGGILEEYNTMLYRRNERCKYRMGDEVFHATLLEADKTGKLILEKDGERITAGFGEIEFVI